MPPIGWRNSGEFRYGAVYNPPNFSPIACDLSARFRRPVVGESSTMTTHPPDTEELLRRAAAGDEPARQALLARHRDRLRRMVAVRLDPRLAARVDPSDVVQEALLDAAGRLDDYLRARPVAFYPWLRRLAWEHLVKLHERHLHARKRSVLREEPGGLGLPDGSAELLAQRLAASASSPSRRLLRAEMHDRVRA